jgi:hypothetical protein
MTHNPRSGPVKLPAPCLVDTGIVVNKQDMYRLLADLGQVRYVYTQDGVLLSDGEGYVLEVFSDPVQSTLVANSALYINVSSFDYLQLKRSPNQETYFDLIQDGLRLRLIPLVNPVQEQIDRRLSAATLEAVVAEVLSASWDARLDGEDHFSL